MKIATGKDVRNPHHLVDYNRIVPKRTGRFCNQRGIDSEVVSLVGVDFETSAIADPAVQTTKLIRGHIIVAGCQLQCTERIGGVDSQEWLETVGL